VIKSLTTYSISSKKKGVVALNKWLTNTKDFLLELHPLRVRGRLIKKSFNLALKTINFSIKEATLKAKRNKKWKGRESMLPN
jgi:hypothetical protein